MDSKVSILLWVFIDILLYACMILPFLSQIKKRQGLYIIESKHGRNFYRYLILIIIFCVFDKTSGDYFHYKEYVNELINYKENYSGLEDIYFYIIKAVNGSYFLFRLVVWGSAVLIYFRSSRYLKIDKDISIWGFLIIVLLNFSYARVSLAISLFILGYIMLCKKSAIRVLLGIGFIIISLFCHKSIYILVPVALASFLPFNRKMIFLSLLAFPVCIHLINYFIGDFIFLLEDGTAEMYYLNQERGETGIAQIVESTLLFCPIIFFLYKFLRDRFLKRKIVFPIEIERLIILSFYILYVSCIINFLDIGSNAIYYRIRNMAIIPMSYVISYYIGNTKFNLITTFAIFSLLIYNFYHMFYMYYLKTLGLGI